MTILGLMLMCHKVTHKNLIDSSPTIPNFISRKEQTNTNSLSAQTVDKPRQRSNFLKEPEKPKGKGTPHVEYNYINTTRKKTRR